VDLVANLSLGFQTALSAANLAYCFVGVLLGTLIGVLPGIGPVPTIAMLLPITYSLEPVSALIMLAGIFYGAQYGGSTTSILVNLPGEASSVVTCLDGHQMALQGRAGTALAIAALGSFFAGTVSTVAIAAAGPFLGRVAISFGPSEYFSLMVLGLAGAVVLGHGSLLKAVAMTVLGLLLGLVGTDVNSGAMRYTFGVPELGDGIGFVIIAMGLFGFAEIISNLGADQSSRQVVAHRIDRLWPNRREFRESFPAILRGTILGSILGVLPGGGAMLSSFASYALEKKIAKDPSRFGRGAIEGVAGPESANNAGAQTSFIPMLTLGIPGNSVMALMVGALMIHNIQPGPQVMTGNPALFWGLIASMWIGNLMLLVLNLPLIGMWVKLLTLPYRFMYPAILLFCAIGTYSLGNNTFDVHTAAFFGIVGWVFQLLECPPAPLLLGSILGPMMEENLRRALLISGGDATVFVTRPISAVLLAAAGGLVVLLALPVLRAKRKEAFQEEG
jgi:TctA family transporter